MPFLVTQKNVERVFSEHLKEGEKPLSILTIGRGTMGFTDQNRIYRTNFPFWGESVIKEEYTLDDLEACDSHQKNSYTLVLSMTLKGEAKEFKFSMPPMSADKLEAFIKAIYSVKGDLRPDYLDDDEVVIDTILTKKGTMKITDKHIFRLNKNDAGKLEVTEKMLMSELAVFDFYPGKMGALFLYFKNSAGDEELLKISGSTTFLAGFTGNDPDEMIDNIYKQIKARGASPYPDYINDGEEILATIRSAHSKMGAINPGHILRLTSNRLLDLKPAKSGTLELETEIDLGAIKDAKFTKFTGDNGSAILELKIKTDDKKYKFFMGGEFEYALDKVRNHLNQYSAADETPEAATEKDPE